MSAGAQTARCAAQACIFNVTGQCRHALQPTPHDCAHRRSAPTLSTDGLVTFLRRPHGGGSAPLALTLARQVKRFPSRFNAAEVSATAAA